MEQFGSQKPISQLFGTLKSHVWNVNLFHIGDHSEQLDKTHFLQKDNCGGVTLQHSIVALMCSKGNTVEIIISGG